MSLVQRQWRYFRLHKVHHITFDSQLAIEEQETSITTFTCIVSYLPHNNNLRNERKILHKADKRSLNGTAMRDASFLRLISECERVIAWASVKAFWGDDIFINVDFHRKQKKIARSLIKLLHAGFIRIEGESRNLEESVFCFCVGAFANCCVLFSNCCNLARWVFCYDFMHSLSKSFRVMQSTSWRIRKAIPQRVSI